MIESARRIYGRHGLESVEKFRHERLGMIRAMVFDVDGVLIEPMIFASILESKYDLTRDATAPFFQGPFKRCSLGKADLKQELPQYLAKWGWPHSLEEFIRIWFEADSRINQDMLSFVKEIRGRGVPCYVASTQEEHRASYLELEMGLADQFDECFFSCRVRCEKPDRKFYDLVSSEIGVASNELLFLDDFEHNVVGARKAGWNAELHTFGSDPAEVALQYGVL